MEVVVCGLQLQGFIPHGRLDAQLGAPMEFHKGAFALGIDQAEAVHPKAFDGAQAARNGAVAHGPHDHVQRLGHQRDEIPKRIVRRSRLRKATVGLHLHSVHQVGELHRILNEEHRNVVAHQIPIAFIGVELDGKATHIARCVHRTRATGHGRDARKNGYALAGFGQHLGGGVFR